MIVNGAGRSSGHCGFLRLLLPPVLEPHLDLAGLDAERHGEGRAQLAVGIGVALVVVLEHADLRARRRPARPLRRGHSGGD